MDIALISIPHTGTHFTIGLFTGCGFENRRMLDEPDPRRHTVFSAHMLKEGQMAAAERKAREMPLVLPLRHPFVVEASWRRRGRPIPELAECFRTFRDRFYPLASHVMPVDSKRREEHLQAMSVGLGLPLTTNWSVVNGREGTHDLRWQDCTPSLVVQRVAEDLGPIIERYY